MTSFDRNFPGHGLITAILGAGGHVVARVGEGVALPLPPGGGWLPGGSRLTAPFHGCDGDAKSGLIMSLSYPAAGAECPADHPIPGHARRDVIEARLASVV